MFRATRWPAAIRTGQQIKTRADQDTAGQSRHQRNGWVRSVARAAAASLCNGIASLHADTPPCISASSWAIMQAARSTFVEESLGRDDLVRLVARILAAEGTEEEIAGMVTRLRRNVPDPQVSNYIFWSDPQLTPEEIVDRALAYKPILL